MDTTRVLYHSNRYSLSTADEVKRTQRQFQGAEAKDTFVLIFLLREILDLWGLVNGSDFAIPCLVITHALSYIHNMGEIRLKRWQKLAAQKVCFLEQ